MSDITVNPSKPAASRNQIIMIGVMVVVLLVLLVVMVLPMLSGDDASPPADTVPVDSGVPGAAPAPAPVETTTPLPPPPRPGRSPFDPAR